MLAILAIKDIVINENRQREIFGEQELEELKTSIQGESGLITPILVRPGKKEGTYILVAGERRLRAISTITEEYAFGTDRINPGFIPVVVKPFSSDIAAYEAELHENIMRVNLSWQERAKAIASLHEYHKMLNPQQTISRTAYLIDQSPTAEKTGYANASAVKTTQNAILVNSYLHDPEVAKAASLKDATKIVTRKLEEENLLRLRAYSEKKREEEAARLASVAQERKESLEDAFDLELLTPVPSSKILGSNTLLEGDMKEKIKEIPDNSINVIITDPPYGVGVEDFGDSGNAAMPHEYSEEDYEELHEVLVNNLSRICASSAHVYIFCDLEYFHVLRDMIRAQDGWRVRRKPLIWNKGSTGNLSDGSAQGYKSSYECILYATRGKRPCGAVTSDVLYFPMVKNKTHAAQKPTELYKRLLEMSSVPGDKVLDAFAGSGTIFRAAKDFAIEALGIEKSPVFCELCKLAIEDKEPEL